MLSDDVLQFLEEKYFDLLQKAKERGKNCILTWIEDEDNIYAEIKGDNDVYVVIVDLNDGYFSCTCKRRQKVCWHKILVLLQRPERIEPIVRREWMKNWRRNRKLLSIISPA